MPGDEDVFPFSPLLDEYDEYMEYVNDARLARLRAARSNQSSVARETHFVERIGKYVTPPSNTWQSYSDTVRHCGLDFDVQGHIFDKAVGVSSKNRAVFDPAARHYTDYEPLRHNIAVIRNFVLNHIYGTEIDTEEAKDEQKFSYVVQIGNAIGDMLRRGNNPLLANPFAPSVSIKETNVEYDGAVNIYKKLRSTQTTNKLLAPLDYLTNIWRQRYLDQNWKLPPIEVTPFGKLNYYAPPPADSIAASDSLMDASLLQAAALRRELSGTLAMDAVGTTLADKAVRYNDVENLAQPVKLQAIEIAREILEKLKIQFQGTPMMAMLDYNSGNFQRTITDLHAAIAVYEDHLQRAVVLDPSLRDDPMVLRANDAVGFLGTQIKLRALDRAEMTGNTDHADVIRSDLDKLPARWVNPNSFTSTEALVALEEGIQMVLTTLLMIQQESMEQSQRGLLLQASLNSPQEQQRRMDSLAFDENYQRLIQERHRDFQAQLGGHGSSQRDGMAAKAHTEKKASRSSSSASSLTPQGMPLASATATSFDTLLSGAGANMQQMQNTLSAPTTGNFTAGAPGSIQQVIAQHIRSNPATTNSTRPGQREERQKRRQAQQEQQVQQEQKEARAARRTQETQARAQLKEAEKKEKEPQPAAPPTTTTPGKRDRNPLGR